MSESPDAHRRRARRGRPRGHARREPVDLTATEYRLLRYLMLNPRRVLTRAQLLEHVWEYDFGGDARVLETYVSYLRKKLDVHGAPPIHTVRAVGYALRRPRT
jgi:two-component system, OmpR family, response regulator